MLQGDEPARFIAFFFTSDWKDGVTVSQRIANPPLPRGASGFESRSFRSFSESGQVGMPPRLGRGNREFKSHLSDFLEMT